MRKPLRSVLLVLLAVSLSACEPPSPAPDINARGTTSFEAHGVIVDGASGLPRAGVAVRLIDKDDAAFDRRTESGPDGVFRIEVPDPRFSDYRYRLEIQPPDCRSEKCKVCVPDPVVDRFCANVSGEQFYRPNYQKKEYWLYGPALGNKRAASVVDGKLDLKELIVIDEQLVQETYGPACERLQRDRAVSTKVTGNKNAIVLVSGIWRLDVSSQFAGRWDLVCVAQQHDKVGTYKRLDTGESVGDATDVTWNIVAVRSDGKVFRNRMTSGAATSVTTAIDGSLKQMDALDQRLTTWLRETAKEMD